MTRRDQKIPGNYRLLDSTYSVASMSSNNDGDGEQPHSICSKVPDLSSIRAKIRELLAETDCKKAEIGKQINGHVSSIDELKSGGGGGDGGGIGGGCCGGGGGGGGEGVRKGCCHATIARSARGCFDNVINVEHFEGAERGLSFEDFYKGIDP